MRIYKLRITWGGRPYLDWYFSPAIRGPIRSRSNYHLLFVGPFIIQWYVTP